MTAVGIIADTYNKPASGGGSIPLTGLAAWYDADDVSTFSFSTGTIISQVRDKSVNGLHLANVNGPHANLQRTGSINGRTAILSDHPAAPMTLVKSGVDPTFFLGNGTDTEFFIVGKWTANIDSIGIVGPNTRVNWQVSMAATNYLDIVDYTGGRLTPTLSLAVGTPYLLTGYRNGTNMAIRVNGVEQSSKSNAGTTPGVSGDSATFSVGTGPNYGNLGEVIIYKRALSTVERQQVESYLTSKWGIGVASPIPQTGLAAWYDADDASTFTFSSGSKVSQWRDKSGGNKHANQATTAAQPTLVASTINSKPAILFENTALITSLPADTKPVHLFLVAKMPAVMPGIGYVLGSDPGGNSYLSWDVSSGKSRILRTGVALIGETISTAAVSVVTSINVSYATGGAWAFYRDGVIDGSGTNDQPLDAGFVSVIGSQAGSGFYTFNGHIAELIKYDRVLSTVERQQVESYLKTKWGTP